MSMHAAFKMNKTQCLHLYAAMGLPTVYNDMFVTVTDSYNIWICKCLLKKCVWEDLRQILR